MDLPVWGSLYFQNGASPVMEQLIFFHDHSMMIMMIVVFLVGYVLVYSSFLTMYNRYMYEGQEMESLWTVLPGVILVFIAFPSLRLLYMMEEMEDSEMSVKGVGHQWFWSYEYADLGSVAFDSYMKDQGVFRLLDVDNSLIIPYKTSVRMIVSSNDVIHSWTIPSLGVKADAIPGRLNQMYLFFSRPGIYYGQCSEICGSNHSFMPIKMDVMGKKEFFLKLS